MLSPRTYARWTLTRWLGPWAAEQHRPQGVTRRAIRVDAPDGPLEVALFAPAERRPTGALLLIPGLHFLGPADPRMDRFARILAAAGFVVASPALPDFLALRITPRLFADTEAAYAALLDQPEVPSGARPGVFSISFGSLAALRLAASERFRERVGGAVIFGGFADHEAVMRFSVGGPEPGQRAPYDPLNKAVSFITLLPHLPDAPEDAAAREALRGAWRRFIYATWGQPRYRTGGARYQHVARDIARALPEALRELFLIGVGAEPGGLECITATLEQRRDALAFLDPRPHLSGLRCPVTVIHGRDDDVIPVEQATRLVDALPDSVSSTLCLTGLYEHSASGGVGGGVRHAVRELATMARMLDAIVITATQGSLT